MWSKGRSNDHYFSHRFISCISHCHDNIWLSSHLFCLDYWVSPRSSYTDVVFLQELHWSELCDERDEGGDGPDTETLPADRRTRFETKDNSQTDSPLSQWNQHQDQTSRATGLRKTNLFKKYGNCWKTCHSAMKWLKILSSRIIWDFLIPQSISSLT